MSATEAEFTDDDVYLAGRRRLYAFLDVLKRGDLELGPADYARVDRVLLLLAARGIRPDHPAALNWLAPVLCGTPAEQQQFHESFYKFVGAAAPDQPSSLQTAPARKSTQEIAIDRQPKRESSLRRWIVVGIVGVVAFMLAVAIGHFSRQSLPKTERDRQTTLEVNVPPPDLSTSLLNRPLALLPLAGLGLFLLWRRSRRFKLMRAFAPAPHRSEKVAFAAAQPRFYAEPGLRRAFAAFRRHWAAPGGALHVRRTINATMRAGGRPELRYGTRPRTPEYVLLVDRETSRDHLSAAAALLVHQLTEERIIIARYDYYGDPRRLVSVDGSNQDGGQLKLLDVAALHAQHTILIFAEASTFFDAAGRPHRWVATVREWGRPILLTPRPPELWDEAEREIEHQGIPVIPALSQGLEVLAEKLKLGPDLPVTSWKPDDRQNRIPSSRFDLAMGLERHRGMLTDETPPSQLAIDELLMDLRAGLGRESFLLLQALAVFPRLEPALTVHLGTNLFLGGKPLLNEKRLLAIGRLPWLRVGSMPEWLRGALVRGLDKQRLEQVIDLLQSFLQPIEDPRSGALSLEIGRRRGQGFRDLLLQWIKRNQTDDLDDRILVDALSGRDPLQLGVPIPPSLARKLKTLFYGTDSVVVAFAIFAAGLVALLHASIVNLLRALRDWIMTLLAPLEQWQSFLGISPRLLLALAWATMFAAVILWLILQSRRKMPAPMPVWMVLIPLQLLFVAFSLAFFFGVLVSPAGTPFFMACLILFLIINLSFNWQVSEAAPRARLFVAPGPLIVELPLFAIWIAVPSFAASAFAIADYSLGSELVLLETASIALAAFFIFCKTRMYPVHARGSLTDSWRIAVMFGLGQSLLPLLLTGTLLLGDDQLRSANGHSVAPDLAFTLTRVLSGMIFLQATFGREDQDGSWLWPPVVIAVYAWLVLIFGSNLKLSGDASSPLFPNPANGAIGGIFSMVCVFATGKFLSRHSRAFDLVKLAVYCGGTWSILTAFSVTNVLGTTDIVALTAMVFWITLQFTGQGRSDANPSGLQALSAAEIIRETRAFLAASMPWPLVPVLWLAAMYVYVPPLQSTVSGTDLFLPAAVWLGYRYPARATMVLATGGLPLLLTVNLGMFGSSGSLGAFVAALLVAHLVTNRQTMTRIFEADTITSSQLFMLLVLFGAGSTVNLGALHLNWSFSYLIPVVLFLIGLSRVPVYLLSAGLVGLAIAAPPLLKLIFAEKAGPLQFYHFLADPSGPLSGVLVLMFGRSVRSFLFDPEPRGAIGGFLNAVNPILVVGGIGILLVVLRNAGLGVFSTTSFGLVSRSATFCFLLWAGIRFGRSPALVAWAVVVLTGAAFDFPEFLSSPSLPPPLASFAFEFPPSPFPVRLVWQLGATHNIISLPLLAGIAYAALGWRIREMLAGNPDYVEATRGSSMQHAV